MKTCDVTKLADRIRQEYGFAGEVAYNKAVQTLKECPAALYPNVQEWSEKQELTDIYVGKYSLPMLLVIWNSRDFLKALEVMTELTEGNVETAEMKIWNMRR